jgi:hypothetical protein
MITLIALAISLSIVSPGSALSQTAEPLTFYMKYLDVLAKAKTLDDLLPYYTKELREGLAKMPDEMKANYLKMNKRVLKDLKVTKQQIGADQAVFELTATAASGQPASGKVTMVKEGTAWKIDDDAWAMPLK